jgi:hypothetical protein
MPDLDITPFIMSEHKESYRLLLTEFDRGAAVFEANGYDSGGYAWHGVAETLIRLRAPHLADKVKFDPESSMFVAYGPDRDALVELAALLKSAMDDRELLQIAISNADPDSMD